jgi:hypothetical protein
MNLYKIHLKKISIYSLLLFTLFACESNKSSEKKDSLATTVEGQSNSAESDSKLNEDIVSLILNGNKGEREKNIGLKLSNVIATEVLVPTDSASNYIAYTQYFNDSEEEFADIQYFHNGDIVTALNMDVYLNKETDVAILFNKLNLKFTDKFGKGAGQDKMKIWKLKNGQDLTLKDVSVKLAPGLQITFAKKGDNTTIE